MTPPSSTTGDSLRSLVTIVLVDLALGGVPTLARVRVFIPLFSDGVPSRIIKNTPVNFKTERHGLLVKEYYLKCYYVVCYYNHATRTKTID